jgi:AraC-like DNA-binding protein
MSGLGLTDHGAQHGGDPGMITRNCDSGPDLQDVNCAHEKLIGKFLILNETTDDVDIVARLRRALRLGLITGDVSGDRISAQIGVARRSLHRQLKAQEVGFQGILDELRFELSRKLLTNTRLPIAEISVILLYADQAVFTRAFFRWARDNPSSWRKNHHNDTSTPEVAQIAA